MRHLRKKIFIAILVILGVLAFLFRESIAGPCLAYIIIQSIMFYLFRTYASNDLAETFQEDGQNVKGWRS